MTNIAHDLEAVADRVLLERAFRQMLERGPCGKPWCRRVAGEDFHLYQKATQVLDWLATDHAVPSRWFCSIECQALWCLGEMVRP